MSRMLVRDDSLEDNVVRCGHRGVWTMLKKDWSQAPMTGTWIFPCLKSCIYIKKRGEQNKKKAGLIKQRDGQTNRSPSVF
jgi:hypothetical protein